MEDTPSDAGMYIKKEGISAYQLWQVHKRRLALRKEYLDRWEATAKTTSTGRPVDAIISPAAAYASAPHGKNKLVDYIDSEININLKTVRLRIPWCGTALTIRRASSL